MTQPLRNVRGCFAGNRSPLLEEIYAMKRNVVRAQRLSARARREKGLPALARLERAASLSDVAVPPGLAKHD